MTDSVRDLYGEIQRSISQFIYFVLGAAGGAIAFAVHQTTGKPLAPAMIPIGAAVALWALSFFCGLVALQRRQASMTQNLNLNIAKKSMLSLHPEALLVLKDEMAAADKGVKDASGKVGGWVTAQRWFLFLGALAFLGGHVWQMAQVPVQPIVATAH